MKLGKGLKKSKRQVEENVSDPGSEDSWEFLYKVDKTSQSKNSLNSNDEDRATSRAVPEARPVSVVKEPKKATDGEKVQKSVTKPLALATLESRNDEETVSMKGLGLPFTSTPFIKRKRAPEFEVSAIISPVDEGTPNDDSGSILIVKRKTPVGSTDETFNNLANPGGLIPSSTVNGIRPLKSVLHQADTTRQYAGGGVRNVKRNQWGKLSEESVGSSWTTAEEQTASSSKKYSSNSETRIRQNLKIVPSLNNDVRESSGTNNDGAREIIQEVHERSQNMGSSQIVMNPLIPKISGAMSGSCNASQSDILSKDMKATSSNSKKRRTLNPYENIEHPNLAVEAQPNLLLEKTSSSTPIDNSSVSNPKTAVRKGKNLVAEVIVEKSPKEANRKAVTSKQITPLPHEDPSNGKNRGAVKGISKQQEQNLGERGKTSCQPEREAKMPGSCRKPSLDEDNTAQLIISSDISSITSVSKLNDDVFKQTDGNVDQKIQRTGIQSSDDEMKSKNPLSCENPPKDHANLNQSSVSSQVDHSNVIDGILKETDGDLAPSVAQNVPEKACSPEKNIMFGLNSNFAVKLGRNVLIQSSQFAFGWKGIKSQTAAINCAQPPTDSRVNTITGQCDQRKDLPHDQAQSPGETNSSQKVLITKKSAQRGLHGVEIETTSTKVDDHSNIDSSSEEEKRLLLAQSLQSRQNQSQACRKIKINKILESKLLASHTASDAAERNSIYFKPGTGKKQDQQSEQQKSVLFSQSKAPSKPIENVLKSSCHADPDDGHQTDASIQLEIMSSSEEEGDQISKHTKNDRIKNRELQKDQVPAVTDQPKKGGNLSFKSKQIRRRREVKLQGMLKSRRNSSDSDSQVFAFLKKSKPGPETHSKGREKRLADVPPNTSDFCEAKDEALSQHLDLEPKKRKEEPDKESIVGVTKKLKPKKKLIVQKKEKNTSRKKLSLKNSVQKFQMNEINLEPIPENILQSSEENSNLSSRDVDENVENDCRSSSVNSLAPKERGLKRTLNTSFDQGSSEVPEKVSKGKEKRDLKSSKKKFHLCPSEKALDIAHGTRQSSRARKSPSAYWVGSRGLVKTHQSDHEDINTEAFIPAHFPKTKAAKPKAMQNQNQNQKNKFQKHDGSVQGHTVPNQSKKEPKSSQIFGSQKSADKGEVLQYEGGLEGEKNACKMYEMKKVECVWGGGMKGDLLSLGTGANFTNYNQQISTAQSTVFYILEGDICYQLGLEKKTFFSGSFFIVPQGEVYHIKNIGSSTGKLIMVTCKA